MTVDPKTLLKFANLQMAAESVFSFRPGRDDAISQPGNTAAYPNIRPDDLLYGNKRSSRNTGVKPQHQCQVLHRNIAA